MGLQIQRTLPSDQASLDRERTFAEIARATLKDHFANVAWFLTLTTTSRGQCAEHVHQLRVSTRRLIATLNLFQDGLDPVELKQFNKTLKMIRKATGDARDLDVFLQRYQTKRERSGLQKLLGQLARHRVDVLAPIMDMQHHLHESGEFATSSDRLLETFDDYLAGETNTIVNSLQARLRQVIARFREAATTTEFKPASLHRLRIRAKQLRYTVESASCIIQLNDTQRSILTKLQKQLGTLNDQRSACGRLKEMKQSATTKKRTRRLEKLLRAERGRRDKSIKKFRKWWTPKRAEKCIDSFESMIATAAPSEDVGV